MAPAIGLMSILLQCIPSQLLGAPVLSACWLAFVPSIVKSDSKALTNTLHDVVSKAVWVIC